jgi:hypothetical protein
MGVMVARKLRLTVAALLCGLCCVLGAAAAPAMAGVSSIGEFGSGAGQIKGAAGVAVDRSTGNLYVSDRYNYRIDKFASSGAFLFGWGWFVNASEPLNELQTCTVATGCRTGNARPGAGGFSGEGPQGIAVDDNSPVGDPSSGDVYVVDWEAFRVEKFDPEGKFLLMFGGEVNEGKDATPGATAAEKDVCAAGEKCTSGVQGAADGQFEWAFLPHGIVAVGPNGRVYVGDKARVEVFEPSGAWSGNISLASLSTEGKVTSLAVNSAGDVFVKDQGVPGVREFEPGGLEALVRFDEGSEAVQALAMGGSGDLFVADSTGGFRVLEYAAASGQELASFASEALSFTSGIALSEALGDLYAGESDKVRVLPLPKPGPLLVSETASAGAHGTATLEAVLNAEGGETAYHFEYVSQAAFETGGYATALSTAATSLAAGFEDQAVSAGLNKLAPAVYHYRILATNAKGTVTGPDQTFTTVPLEGPWASNVAGASATLSARVNPLGLPAEYRIEYGTSTAYGQTLSGGLGEGSEYVQVTRHVQELQPATEYHYRLLIINEFGTFASADHVFTTQVVGSALTLPDGRAWELVSPVDKKGALIEPFERSVPIKASSGGDAMAYYAKGPHVGENPQESLISQVFSTREPGGGWRSQDVTLSAWVPAEGEPDFPLKKEQVGYSFFSEDLSLGMIFSQAPRSPGVKEGTLYFRDMLDGSFSPLVSEANVSPPGTEYGGGSNLNFQMHVLAGTPDMSHVVFESPLALVSPAASHGEVWNLYEWDAGRIQLVNILPDGTVASGVGGAYSVDASPVLGGEQTPAEASFPWGGVQRAVSSDGRRIAWTWGSAYGDPAEYKGLYVRDMVEGRTVRIGGPSAKLQMMNADGSRILYLEGGELYEYDFATGKAMDLTSAHGAGELSAGVQELVLGAGEDGASVYFVANGVLSGTPNAFGERATPGNCINTRPVVGHLSPPGSTCNLYVDHNSGGAWEAPRFIATLSGNDEPSWYATTFDGAPSLPEVSSRVSSSGRYLAFMSERSLTGYDNTDAFSGQPDEEVYLYDSLADRLVCVSCNPTGARPVGIHDSGPEEGFSIGKLLVDRTSAWWQNSIAGPSGKREGHWLAGSIPGWDEHVVNVGSYQPRFLSDDGRVFFDSPDGLVPQATNGVENVYEYEPPAGPGMPASDTCTTGSASYNARSGGCVSLISSGISSGESMFYDASESGDDVFLLTAAKLVGEDYDTGFDVYDAHACSAGAPCRAEVVGLPPCTSGDSCKPAPAPQPEIFGAPPSGTFNGVGNVSDVPKAAVKPKAKKHAKHHKKRKRKGKRARKSVAGGARKVRK